MDLIKVTEGVSATDSEFSEFKTGDTIIVIYKIVEGTKQHIQLHHGVVIKILGHGTKRRSTVRKMSGTVGIEHILPVESLNTDSIEMDKRGKVRCAKPYCLCGLISKRVHTQERRTVTNK